MEYLSPSPTSRFQVLERAAASPGKCIICGSVNRPVVDFGMSVIGYGAIYFCGLCICEAARPFKMVSASELVDNEKATDLIVKDYLNRNNLNVVSNERTAIINALVADLCAAVISFGNWVPPVPDEIIPKDSRISEGQGKLFDFDNDGVVVQRVDEIDFDTLIQDSLGISDSSKHESGKFQLE